MRQRQPSITITATEAQTHFGALIRRVYRNGEHLIVERDGLPVAVIIPVGEYTNFVKHNSEGR